MSFFTYFYLENKMYFHDYLKYIVIFITLGTLLLASTLYLRHRIESKYRDLSIISLLLIQYTQYEQNQIYANDSSQIITFLNSVRDNQQLKNEDLIVNDQKLTNGMIIGIKGQYFEVHFNNDFTAYTLSEINLVNSNINLIDKENK